MGKMNKTLGILVLAATILCIMAFPVMAGEGRSGKAGEENLGAQGGGSSPSGGYKSGGITPSVESTPNKPGKLGAQGKPQSQGHIRRNAVIPGNAGSWKTSPKKRVVLE